MTTAQLSEAEKVQQSNDRRAAYSEATTKLRQAHLTEFNTLMKQGCAERGIEWEPKPTAVDRARQQIQALLGEYPELQDQFGPAEDDVPE
jgi:hypothetical protein